MKACLHTTYDSVAHSSRCDMGFWITHDSAVCLGDWPMEAAT